MARRNVADARLGSTFRAGPSGSGHALGSRRVQGREGTVQRRFKGFERSHGLGEQETALQCCEGRQGEFFGFGVGPQNAGGPHAVKAGL